MSKYKSTSSSLGGPKCRWFSLGTLVCSTNKTYGNDITEIPLKVALSAINQTSQSIYAENAKRYPQVSSAYSNASQFIIFSQF